MMNSDGENIEIYDYTNHNVVLEWLTTVQETLDEKITVLDIIQMKLKICSTTLMKIGQIYKGDNP
jgi:hypothetical protein